LYFLFKWIWKGLAWLGGAIVAPLANLRHVSGIGRIIRCAVHVAAVILVLVGLGFVNYWFQLDTLLVTPLPVLRYVWLPVLFGLCYLLVVLGWYVCRSLLASDQSSPHQDLDDAWQQAVSVLDKAGIEVANTPLYLLVGRPHGDTHDLIRAGGVPLITPPTPSRDRSPPVQVFANRDAVYVSCCETSLLGRQAGLLATAPELDAEANKASSGERPERVLSEGDVDVEDLPWEADGGGGVATATTTRKEKSHTQQGLALVEEGVAQLVSEFEPENAFPEQVPAAALDPLTQDLECALLRDSVEMEAIRDRLGHLCNLIAEQRHPHVPLHGILIASPAAATDSEVVASHVGELIRLDLETIQSVMQVDCPHVLLVCDLERTPGADALLERFPQEQKQRRLGVRLPDTLADDFAHIGKTIDDAVDWLDESLLTPLSYRLIRAPQDGENEDDVVRGNLGIYRFVYRMRQRSRRLTVLLRRMTAGDGHHFRLPAGCYLVASGEDSSRDHGFAEAVFSQLPQLTSTLRWTDEALSADRRRRLLARLGLAGVATTVAASLAVAFSW